MKLWLLCFVLIFAAAEGLNSASGLSLMPATAWHPLTVLAGIGLAVLSNAQGLGLGSSRPPATPKSPPLTPQATSTAAPPLSSTAAASPASGNAKASTQASSKVSPALKPRFQAKTPSSGTAKVPSISFDLRRSK